MRGLDKPAAYELQEGTILAVHAVDDRWPCPLISEAHALASELQIICRNISLFLKSWEGPIAILFTVSNMVNKMQIALVQRVL